MKEDILRKMIRSQIKRTLTEQPSARGTVTTRLGNVEKMAGIKMLKKALGAGSAQQQAAGLLAVIKSISGNDPAVLNKLALMLRKDKPAPAPAPEPTTEAKVSSALSSKMGRVDKTQAMQMMKKMLKTKPAIQQADFILNMLKDFDIKDSAKKRIFIRMRKELGKKD
ncbi:MAG: hypothetical protein H8E55_39510 [Pelagibacterales bacterium]|nr:hypothetical protein [Pelagibacterales bacterium]